MPLWQQLVSAAVCAANLLSAVAAVDTTRLAVNACNYCCTYKITAKQHNDTSSTFDATGFFNRLFASPLNHLFEGRQEASSDLS